MRGERGAVSTVTVLGVADPSATDRLVDALEAGSDLTVTTAPSIADALTALEETAVDCVVSCDGLPDGDCEDLLAAIGERHPDLPVIVCEDSVDDFDDDVIEDAADSVLYDDATLPTRVEASVRRSERERRYRTLVENLPGIVYRTTADRDWTFEFVDGECTALTGYTATELVEEIELASELVHPEDHDRIAAEIEAALERKEPYEVTYRLCRRDGEERWVWERGRSIGGGRLEGFITDVTARVAYERDLGRYRTIVEASGDAMYTLDRDGHLTLVNDSFVELVGHPRERLIGEHIGLVMTDEDVERGEALIRSLLSSDDRRGTFEMDVCTAEGNRIPVENNMVLLPSEEEFRGTAGVLRDITERKHREEVLQRERDRLEQFASVISHDLRNPLTVAQGYLDIARNGNDPEAFDLIDQSLDRMERIIDDVLWLAREGRDIGEVEPVELADALGEAWSHVAGTREDVVLEYGDLETIEADYDRLCQLLENLFRNAIEHAGPAVTVRAESVEGGFAIEDDGEGIPPDVRDRVFERGFTTNRDGTGLGLHIVGEIASAHGWSIDLEDGRTGGARFVFRNG